VLLVGVPTTNNKIEQQQDSKEGIYLKGFLSEMYFEIAIFI